MKIYIAARLTAKTPDRLLMNGGIAIRAAIEVMKKGHIPFVPPLDYLIYMMSTPEDLDEIGNEYYYKYSCEWLKCCDAIVIVNGLDDSKGVKKEYKLAQDLGMKIFKNVKEIPYAVHKTGKQKSNR